MCTALKVPAARLQPTVNCRGKTRRLAWWARCCTRWSTSVLCQLWLLPCDGATETGKLYFALLDYAPIPFRTLFPPPPPNANRVICAKSSDLQVPYFKYLLQRWTEVPPYCSRHHKFGRFDAYLPTLHILHGSVGDVCNLYFLREAEF